MALLHGLATTARLSLAGGWLVMEARARLLLSDVRVTRVPSSLLLCFFAGCCCPQFSCSIIISRDTRRWAMAMWCHNDASNITVEVSSSCLASLQNKHNSSSCRVVCGSRTFDASVRRGNGFFLALYDVSLRHEANHWQNNLANRCSKPLARSVSRLSTSFQANRFKFRAHFANLEFVLYVGVVNAESANPTKFIWLCICSMDLYPQPVIPSKRKASGPYLQPRYGCTTTTTTVALHWEEWSVATTTPPVS